MTSSRLLVSFSGIPNLRLMVRAVAASLLLTACGGAARPAANAPEVASVAPRPIDRTAFTTDACRISRLASVTPARPVDGMELRQRIRQSEAGAPPFIVVERFGKPCKGAVDADRCQEAFERHIPTAGWTAYSNVPPDWRRVLYLVYTRGDEVGLVGSLDELVAFLAPVDTPAEVDWIVADRGPYRLVCGEKNVRSTSRGFEVLTETGSCARHEEHVVAVDRLGRATVLVDAPAADAGLPCMY
jgi:hypothetical protein